jgi:hypothetical protein
MGWRKLDPMVWAAAYALAMPFVVALAATPAVLPVVAKDGAAWTQAIGSVLAIIASSATALWTFSKAEEARRRESEDRLKSERESALALYTSALTLMESAALDLSGPTTVGAVNVLRETLAGMRTQLLQHDLAATRDPVLIVDLATLPGVLGDHVETLHRSTVTFVRREDAAIILMQGYFADQTQSLAEQAARLRGRLERFASRSQILGPAEFLIASVATGPDPSTNA